MSSAISSIFEGPVLFSNGETDRETGTKSLRPRSLRYTIHLSLICVNLPTHELNAACVVHVYTIITCVIPALL